ncbi:hypothetical protein KAU11_02025, partial [Candidatus Babeliales bacterium]|nr:hypothetical protein [Candidatus Babeliales bacterium]
MKKYLALLLVFSIVITGCKDKDKEKKDSAKKTTVAKSGDSPLMYQYEDAELFAEGDVAILEDELLPDGSTAGVDEELTVATADEVEKEIDKLVDLWTNDTPENLVAEYKFNTINFEINKSEIKEDQEELLQE